MTPLLRKSQLRFVIRHPVGPAASLIGVVLAVLAVVTVHLLSQSIRVSLEDPDIGGHTHIATRETLEETDYFELRRRWLDPGGAMASVEAMVPVIEGFVDIRGQPRRILGFDPLAVCTNCGVRDGGDATVPAMNPVAEGVENAGFDRYLTEDVVIASPETARAIEADGGRIRDLAVTVIESDTGVLLADLPTAQRLLDREGEIDAVWIRVRGIRRAVLSWLDGLLPGIAASLPRYADPVIDGYTVTAKSRWNPSRRFADAIVFNLGMLSLLCLLMAAFIAFQASASNAARRLTEHGRLAAIGADPRSLRMVSCAEASVVGILGAAIGLALGAFLADVLLHSVGAGSTAPRLHAPALDGWVVGKALVCGALVSTLGPLTVGHSRRKGRGFVLGFLALVIALLALAEGSLGACFVALLAVCLAHILHVVPLAGAAARRFAAWGRTLATRSSLRAVTARSGEIRVALGALSLAVAVAIGMDLMVESLRRDFSAMLDVRLQEGIYLRAEPGDPDLDTAGLAELAGVREVRRYADVRARFEQGPLDVRLARLDAVESARYGFDGPLEGRAMLNEVGARLFDIDIGDTMTIVADGVGVPVEIAHVFRDFGAAAPRVILPDTFLPSFSSASPEWRRVSILAEPRALPRLTATLSERYGASRVSNQSDVRSLAMAVFDRTFVVSRSLTFVALLVAAVGLYAALTALQAGRVDEFRLLSAVGHSRAGLWRLALSESTALGATAVTAAIPLGVVLAWVLCAFVNPAAFGWSIELHLEPASIALPVLLGLGCAVAAGAVPTYRASFRGGL